VRGRGFLWGVEFVADRQTRTPFPPERQFAQRLVSRLRQAGVVVAAGIAGANFGRGADHIQISPPFTIGESEIDILIASLDEALAAEVQAARNT
jgi:4-aminobutyrate aminotransferase-like enzyme